MTNKLVCPLTGSNESLEIIEIIYTEAIVDLYKRCRNLDISHEFTSDKLYLVKNKDINFYFFHPFICGSGIFYEQLTSNPQYVPEKDEYLFATKYIKDSDRVLDVGCGWGWFKSYVPNNEYLGIELSQQSIRKCKARDVKVSSTSIQDFAKTKDKFDVVTAFQVLEHIEDPFGFIQSMVKSIKENGIVIISVPNVESYIGAMENNYLNIPPHHISWWSKECFIYLSQKMALEIVDFHIEKNNDLSEYLGIYFKRKFNSIIRRKNKIIRNNLFDRSFNALFKSIGKHINNLPNEIMPNGHSITFIFRKI